jgi:hypothetical protein
LVPEAPGFMPSIGERHDVISEVAHELPVQFLVVLHSAQVLEPRLAGNVQQLLVRA